MTNIQTSFLKVPLKGLVPAAMAKLQDLRTRREVRNSERIANAFNAWNLTGGWWRRPSPRIRFPTQADVDFWFNKLPEGWYDGYPNKGALSHDESANELRLKELVKAFRAVNEDLGGKEALLSVEDANLIFN